MPTFTITLERMAVMIREVEVDADTEETACLQAIEEDGAGDSYEYGFIDFDDGPPTVIETMRNE